MIDILPPEFHGTEEEQLAQVEQYLTDFHDTLERKLKNLDMSDLNYDLAEMVKKKNREGFLRKSAELTAYDDYFADVGNDGTCHTLSYVQTYTLNSWVTLTYLREMMTPKLQIYIGTLAFNNPAPGTHYLEIEKAFGSPIKEPWKEHQDVTTEGGAVKFVLGDQFFQGPSNSYFPAFDGMDPRIYVNGAEKDYRNFDVTTLEPRKYLSFYVPPDYEMPYTVQCHFVIIGEESNE